MCTKIFRALKFMGYVVCEVENRCFFVLKLFPAKSHLIHTSVSCGGPWTLLNFQQKMCQAHLAVVCRRHQTRSHYGEGCQLGAHSVKLFVSSKMGWFKSFLEATRRVSKKNISSFRLRSSAVWRKSSLGKVCMSLLCAGFLCWNSMPFVKSQLGSRAVNKILGCILHCLLGKT